MSAAFPWLAEPPLSDVLALLDRDGEEARIVGGAVRNALLGEPLSDWDIATTATPDVVGARANAAGWKVVPTGIDHGTVTVVCHGHPFEVTTLREDIATDGRRALVRFGRDFAADALRRDFTINALSLSRDGRIHDYAGGLADIAARRVRFIGDADARIAEDYLRILRLFRFHARFGRGRIDEAAMGAAIRGRAGLAQLSRERVRAEMLKILLAPGAAEVIGEADGAGFLLATLGGVCKPAMFERMAALEHELGLEPDPVRRLAALALFVREDAVRLGERLRLSNSEARRLETMAVAGEALLRAPTPDAARALLYRLKAADYADVVLFGWSRCGEVDWRSALDLAAEWPVPANPFRGADAVRHGIQPGAPVGRFLQRAEQLWIEASFPTERQRLDEIMKAAAQIGG